MIIQIIDKSHRFYHKRHNGFTLVELMIVIAIIGIVGAIATVTFQSFAERQELKRHVQKYHPYRQKLRGTKRMKARYPILFQT